ncbi:MAG: hypothetical protein WBF37_11470 [Dehalococcoidia bacterium]
MAESYQDKLDNFSRGKSFVKLRGGVRNSTSEPCEACGSGQPGTLFGIRELLTGLDHFVGYNCLRELMRKKAVLQGRVRGTTEEAFSRAQKSKERSGNGQFGQGHNGKPAGESRISPQLAGGEAVPILPTLSEGNRCALPGDVPVIATPTLVVWETEDAFRAAVQVQGRNGLAGLWGAAEQPKCRQLLTLQPDNGFLLTKEERYDRAALARCVRLATQNAHLTLQSQQAKPRGDESNVAMAGGTSSG